MIVETTNYFAKPGLAEAVLTHRRKGSVLRISLGLAAGEIFVRQGDKGPDVRWECRFSDEAALAADLAARDKSPEFARQREEMGVLLERFERHVFKADEQGA
ncbi:hypothetical protein GOZ92_23425 [Agrobacterium vitis]|nr:hypothetical protein [Agrobacterium vitis]